MGYSPFKMAPKSPMLKALKGNQSKLPQQLQNAIKAAPESPAKQTKGKMKKELRQIDPDKFTKTYNAATGQSNDPYYNPQKAELYKKNAIAKYGSLKESRKASSKSPAKQTTAGEFAHQQYEMDKKTGKATRDIDKVKSVWDAITTDKTYPEAKKGYREKQKEKYNNMSKVKKVITKATSRQNSHKK